MVELVPWGIGFFDAQFGGLPRGRAALITGRSGSGKTAAAIQFILQGLQNDERVVVVLSAGADEFKRAASQFNPHIEAEIARGHLRIFPMQEADGNSSDTLSLQTIPDLIASAGATRAVVDSVLPWVCPPPTDETESFLMGIASHFEQSGATTLLTMRKPASAASRELRRSIERGAPVSITLTVEGHNEKRIWEVGKYEGREAGRTVEFAIEPGIGLVRKASASEVAALRPGRDTKPAESLADVLLPPRRMPMPDLGESAG